MWFEIPTRKYRHFPAKLVGNHAYRVRNAKGRFTKFRRGSRQTLFLQFRSTPQFLDWLTYLQGLGSVPGPLKPRKKRRKALPRPTKGPLKARKPKAKAKAKAKAPAKRVSERAKKAKLLEQARARLQKLSQWVAAEDILDDLQARYPGLELDHKGVTLKGFQFIGKGIYHGTFWSTRDVVPQDVKSVFIFAVLKIAGYEGAKGNYILAGKQVDWKAHSDYIMEQFTTASNERLMVDVGKYRTMTNLEMLWRTLFRKKIGVQNIVEFVGLRFAHTKAPPPPKHRNPPKRKKKRSSRNRRRI